MSYVLYITSLKSMMAGTPAHGHFTALGITLPAETEQKGKVGLKLDGCVFFFVIPL